MICLRGICKVRDCYISVSLDFGGIVSLETCGVHYLRRFDKFGMRDCKVDLELGPSFIHVRSALLDFAVVLKHTSTGNNVEGGVDNLDRCERYIACGGKIDGILDLVKEGLDG